MRNQHSPGESITEALAARAVGHGLGEIAPDSVEVAKQCLMDWLGVTFAARGDPLVEKIGQVTAENGGNRSCTVIGRQFRDSEEHAVLLNGAMGHALDYDDVITTMGHPTVPIAPVVFAVGEKHDIAGRDVLTAFIAGMDAEVRVARLLGQSHYARGWHSTGTFGTFGAAAVAGRMIGLDVNQMTMAFGIAGTQAAGLKAVFGTMCKPLHAGKAAANGLMAARLAAAGFTSHPDILATAQGFGATQSDRLDTEAALSDPPRGQWVREVLFKYHAACYLTHSAINAATALRLCHNLSPDAIDRIEVGVEEGHLNVCAIPSPTTGLECKFSLRTTTALALLGENTADEGLYSDETAARPDVVALRDRVAITPRKGESPTLSDVTVHLTDGRSLRERSDCAVPAANAQAQWEPLTAKFRALVEPSLGVARTEEAIGLCRTLDEASSVRPLLAVLA